MGTLRTLTIRAALAATACVLLLQGLQAQRPAAPREPDYLLIDAADGRVLASRWIDPERPVPAGSLVKPFAALAYAAAHRYTYPAFTCRGTAGRCWLPQGHGRVGIVEAIEGSCNDYFLRLAGSIAPEVFVATLHTFGLTAPLPSVTPDSMVGLGSELTLPPLALVRAYAELAARAGQPGVAPVLAGMRRSGATGTGRGVGALNREAAALVKTGTSPCIHSPRATADGHTVVLYPADRPRVVLLVAAHGRTGADTATLAGQILAAAPEAR